MKVKQAIPSGQSTKMCVRTYLEEVLVYMIGAGGTKGR